MRKVISLSTFSRLAAVFVLAGALLFTGCKKDFNSGGAGYGNVPRKSVPQPFVGNFTYVTSSAGYVDEYGHYIAGVAHGVTLHIEKDGTGTSLYRVETGNYTGITTDETRYECTYEITKTSADHANIIIHFVSGKDYHNGVFLHDLDASKLYPNGDAEWNDVEYGTNNEDQTIFVVGTSPNTAQFTKQN